MLKKIRDYNGLETVYPVIRELRPHLTFEAFVSLTGEAAKRDGYELVGYHDGSGACIALIGYRVLYDLVHGKHLYIDDLVVTEACRSKGIGAKLLSHAEDKARELGCKKLRLSTGVDRKDAQRFYESNHWELRSVTFKKNL